MFVWRCELRAELTAGSAGDADEASSEQHQRAGFRGDGGVGCGDEAGIVAVAPS